MSGASHTPLVERLHGPVQWGYMCLADGGFIKDDAPVEAADTITELLEALEEVTAAMRRYEMDVDADAPTAHCEMMRKAYASIANARGDA